jgi:hypothetical protein
MRLLRFRFSNFIKNIFLMGIYFRPPIVPQHLGFGNEFRSVNPCLPLVLVFKYLLALISQFGLQLGFLLCLHFFLSQNSQISNFIRAGTTQWNLEALQSVFDVASVYEISKIRISSTSQPRFLWTFSTSGKFSSKSAYLQIKKSQDDLSVLPVVSPDFWKKIWKLNLNDRLRLFLWKIAWNILPTRERLNSVFSSLDSLSNCPLCNDGKIPSLICFLGVVL